MCSIIHALSLLEKREHTAHKKSLEIIVPTGLFINNEFMPALKGSTVEIQHPATCAKLGSLSAAEAIDVDKAVAAAKTTYQTVWKRMSPDKRQRLLFRLADLIESDAEILASLESINAGILYKDSIGIFIPQVVETSRYYTGWADKIDGDALSIPQGMAYTRREPCSVCAAIVPWNAPCKSSSTGSRYILLTRAIVM